MNWYLMPQLLGTQTTLAGTSEALDAFPGWNGLYWGSGPTDDMVLDFDEPDGTACYWREADRRRAGKKLLQLGEYRATKVLYSYVEGRMCSVGFSMETVWDTEGVYVALLAAYGEPDSYDPANGTYAWNGDRIACRLRMKSDQGGSVAWFHVPLTRAVRR
jgi:hypothetical protein